jgi:hypothetical protein
MPVTFSNFKIKQWMLALSIAAPLGAQAAIDIQFDYTYDGGFFTGVNAARQATLDLAASVIENRLVNETFAALTPTSGNIFQLTFDNPGNSGTQVTLNNPIIAANTLKIYVGGSNLGASGQLGNANFGVSYAGTQAWVNTVSARNTSTNYDPLGGGITFNSATNWYFGTDASGLQFSQYDLFTVATHEIFHILGFGQSDAYDADAPGNQFVGSNVQAIAGGPVNLNGTNGDHWAQSTTFQGQTPIMVPGLVNGVRRQATELDYAVLRDIGYNVTAVPEASTWAMSALGLLAIGVLRKRSHNKAIALA